MTHTARPRTSDGSINVIGQKVKEQRKRLRLKQDQLCARIAFITKSRWVPVRQDIYKIESLKRGVSDIEALALCDALECDIAWLYGREKSQPIQPTSAFEDG